MANCTVSVNHTCGHTTERDVLRYSPNKRKMVTIADNRPYIPNWFFCAELEKLEAKTRAYWETKTCAWCWDAGKRIG